MVNKNLTWAFYNLFYRLLHSFFGQKCNRQPMSNCLPFTNMNLLLLICGIPGSGKTQTSRELCGYLEGQNLDVVHIEFDSFDDGCQSLRHRNDLVYLHVRQLVSESTENSVIILDDTFHLASMRKRYFQLTKEFSSWQCLSVFLECPLQLALDRNECRSERSFVNPTVIKSISSKIHDRGPWEHDSTISYSCANVNFLWQLINEKKKTPPNTTTSIVRATICKDTSHYIRDRIKKMINRFINLLPKEKRMANISLTFELVGHITKSRNKKT